MSRHRSTGARGFRVQYIGPGHYRMSWVVDRYYSGSQLRHPRGCSRDTDRAGAERFAKRHGIEMPKEGGKNGT